MDKIHSINNIAEALHFLIDNYYDELTFIVNYFAENEKFLQEHLSNDNCEETRNILELQFKPYIKNITKITDYINEVEKDGFENKIDFSNKEYLLKLLNSMKQIYQIIMETSLLSKTDITHYISEISNTGDRVNKWMILAYACKTINDIMSRYENAKKMIELIDNILKIL